jgi:putative transposase
MDAAITAKTIAAALNLSVRTIQLRAKREQWVTVSDKVRGGRQRLYVFELLPEDVRKAMAVVEASQMGLVPADPNRLPVAPPSMLPERARDIGLAKYRLVKAWRKAVKSLPWGERKEASEAFILSYNTGKLLPAVFEEVGELKEQTVRAMDKKLRDHKDDFKCLCDGRGGWKKHGRMNWRERQISKETQSALLCAYLRPERPSVKLAIRAARYALDAQGIEETVSDATLRRWLSDYCEKHTDVATWGREGEKAYMDRVGPYMDRAPETLNVGDAIVSDGKVLNFTVLHPVTGQPCRMAIIFWVDWRSRYPVGWQIMPTENTVAISAALRMAISTLRMIPKAAYMDNGKAFKAKVFLKTDPDLTMLSGLYARLGIFTCFALPFRGRSKINERFHLTFQEQCERLIPSYCGASIDDKPAHLLMNEKFHRAWHQAKTSGWVPTMREAARIIGAYIEWFVRQPHDGRGMEGRTPLEVLEAGRKNEVKEIDLDHEFLWREILRPRRCRVTLYGVEYESDALHGIGHDVMVMYDTADMNRVYLHDPNGRYMGEAYPVSAITPLATAFGDTIGVDRMKYEMKRQRRLMKRTREAFKAVGATENDFLSLLPYNNLKAPVMNARENSPEAPEESKMPTAEVKRLESLAERAFEEGSTEAAPVRPEGLIGELAAYEWCFYTLYRDGCRLSEEDMAFMRRFEGSPEYMGNYRERFEGLKEMYVEQRAESMGLRAVGQ